MIQLGSYYMVHKDVMEKLLIERDEYYKYKVLAEMRQDDTRQRLEEELEELEDLKNAN